MSSPTDHPFDLRLALMAMEARITAEIEHLHRTVAHPSPNVCVSCGDKITAALAPNPTTLNQMPLYEFVCQSCGAFVERMLNVEYRDEPQRHYPCGQIMVRRPSTASFSVNGFNAANNYSSSKDQMPEITLKTDANGQFGMTVSNDISGQLALVLGFLELGKVAWIEQMKLNERARRWLRNPPGLSNQMIPRHRTPAPIAESNVPQDQPAIQHVATDYEFVFPTQVFTFSIIDGVGSVTEQHDHFLLETTSIRTKVLKAQLLAVRTISREWYTDPVEWRPTVEQEAVLKQFET